MNFDRNFSVLALKGKQQAVAHVHRLFEAEGSAERVGADSKQLFAFIEETANHYFDNPYHNFFHAADATNLMAWILTRPVLHQHIPPLHRLMLMVGTLVHDMEHPGHDNNMEITIKSDWAQKYNNASVLEQHSLSVTMALLQQPALNFLAHLDADQTEEALQLLNRLVLITDFAFHHQFLQTFSHRLTQSWAWKDSDFLSLVEQAAIKAADIGNTAKEYEQSKLWGERVMQEFWAQGREEKAYNLPVAQMHDPAKVELHESQANFIRHEVLGLCQLLARVEPAMMEIVAMLEQNLLRYQMEADALVKK